MEIRKEIIIKAPLKVVWHLFSHMENWDEWNTICRNCCITSGQKTLAPGTCFSFIIRPLIFPLKVQPMIVNCDPGRMVIWEGSKLGINSSHTWQFSDVGGNVKLLSVERFSGPMVWMGYLLGLPKRLRRLTSLFLLAIKRAAEECSS